VTIGAAEILPRKAIPAADVADQLDARAEQVLAGGIEVIYLERDNGRRRQVLLALVSPEYLELLAGCRLEDRLLLSPYPRFKAEHVAEKA
jgi:hypothetical protein